MDPITSAALIKGGADVLGGIFGGGEPQIPRTPFDLQPARRNNVGLTNYLLGFSPSFTPYQRIEGQPGTFGPTLTSRTPAGGGTGRPGTVDLAAMIRSIAGQPTAAQGGPIQRGAVGTAVPFNGPTANATGGAVPFNGPMANAGYAQPVPGGYNPVNTQLPQGAPNNDMLGRIESYFGPLGTPTTALQQQSLGGISQYLASNPYGQSNNALQQILGGQGYNEANQAYRAAGTGEYFGNPTDAFNQLRSGNYYGGAEGVFNQLGQYNPFQQAQGALNGMFAQNPGQAMLEALRPSFERNLAAANQQGGRFGSANAILRSRAVDDYNLLGAQALQRGTDQQIAAAGQSGVLGNALLNARQAAGQGLLGIGQGRAQQQYNAGQGLLGVGQGQLAQALGSAQGLGDLAQAFAGNQLGAAGQLANNQNSFFNALQGGYQTGQQQAQQEAERQQQALQILLDQLAVSQQASLQGRG